MGYRFTKADAERLLKEGYALIDTSGRTRTKQSDSTIAFASNTLQYTIKYKSKVKKNIYPKYEKKHGKNKLPVLFHSIGLARCLEEYLANVPGVFICADGHSIGLLKHYLRMFLGEKYDSQKIRIWSSLKEVFGKKNIADRLAYEVNENTSKPSITLKESDFRKVLGE